MPESITLENLSKMLLGISLKFPLLCLDSFDYATAVSMYVNIISSINCIYSFELVALTVYTTIYGFNYNSPSQ